MIFLMIPVGNLGLVNPTIIIDRPNVSSNQSRVDAATDERRYSDHVRRLEVRVSVAQRGVATYAPERLKPEDGRIPLVLGTASEPHRGE